MSKKRGIELLGSISPPEKRCHVDSTSIENGKVFVVLSGTGAIPAIFLDENEAKLYCNHNPTSVVAFKNFEDAKQYAQEAVIRAKEETTETENAQTEGADFPKTDIGPANIADVLVDSEDANAAARVGELVNSETSDVIDRQEVPVEESIELLVAPVTEPSDYVTVYISSTVAKGKGQIARMSYGIYFGQDSPHNFSGALVGEVSTQRAELIAVLEAIKTIMRENLVTRDGRLELFLTSSYAKNGIDNWMPRWKKSGWKNANRGPLRNSDLWQGLDALLADFGRHRITITVISVRDSVESFAVGRLAESALRESE